MSPPSRARHHALPAWRDRDRKLMCLDCGRYLARIHCESTAPRSLAGPFPSTHRGCSSAGRALHSHCRGQGFEPPQLHIVSQRVGSSSCREWFAPWFGRTDSSNGQVSHPPRFGDCPPLFGRTQSSNDGARGIAQTEKPTPGDFARWAFVHPATSLRELATERWASASSCPTRHPSANSRLTPGAMGH